MTINGTPSRAIHADEGKEQRAQPLHRLWSYPRTGCRLEGTAAAPGEASRAAARFRRMEHSFGRVSLREWRASPWSASRPPAVVLRGDVKDDRLQARRRGLGLAHAGKPLEPACAR